LTTAEQYANIINTAREIFLKKNHDYGSAWRILRTSSLTDQIYIKASRIRTLEEAKESKVEEGIEPEYIGIVNYSVMALIQLEKGSDEKDIHMADEVLAAMYDEKINETQALMERKNHDYGEAWRDMRTSSMTDLILMKLLRIKQIEENDGQTIISEGLDANYQDILNYAVFALIKISEK
jgi:heme oxygenase